MKIAAFSIGIALLTLGCQAQEQPKSMEHKHSNSLIHESSPYLLQHAHNPVDWKPWSEETLKKARELDKPILVSIGYSSCHWCHVMEHESFENEELAALMNDLFICIKVDREERPDVDQIYMEAVQAMGLGGGWPLNVFLTPQGQPFYGGTYFPPAKWEHTIKQIADSYKNNKAKVLESASQLTLILNQSELKKYGLTDNEFIASTDRLNGIYTQLSTRFDYRNGGMDKEPKFPMPTTYKFLNRYYVITKNKEALTHIELTLREMAFGGIYDQIGGGFSRYSTDVKWFAPHFEKMLYDNAQLLSIYSEAYKINKNPLYENIILETINWLQREMLSPEGGFYSALDADSEGEEGKFYIWSQDELNAILADDYDLFSDYYNIKPGGNWEFDSNILFRSDTDETFSLKHQIALNDLQQKISQWKKLLLDTRNKRIHPGLDDKILLGWNALTLSGLLDAYEALGDDKILKLALNNAHFLEKSFTSEIGKFHTYKKGKATLPAYLDDYAALIEAYIKLYENTFDEKWLTEANKLTELCLEQFFDQKEGMFFFTSNEGEQLIARKKELFDNVIPASNSVMATNLYRLGHIVDNNHYKGIANSMMAKALKLVENEPSYMSNWASLFTYYVTPTAEISFIGSEFTHLNDEFSKHFIPNSVRMGVKNSSDLPLLQGKTELNNQSTIYVCFNKTCRLPVNSVAEALNQLK